MSTYKNHGELVFVCDTCDETLETHEPEWNEAWADAKRQGWRAVKRGNGWEHNCPGCAK